MDRLIHTPEGVRDVYNQECTKKLYLENQIEQVFHAFGYQDIEQHRPASSTNSVTATATPLCSVRTLPRRLHAQPPCISWKRRCRSAFATEEAASSTAAAIRAA